MSRTHKDRPYRLGGDRHKYYCVSNHSSHSKFTRLMRKQARRDLTRQFARTGELIAKSRYDYLYFD